MKALHRAAARTTAAAPSDQGPQPVEPMRWRRLLRNRAAVVEHRAARAHRAGLRSSAPLVRCRTPFDDADWDAISVPPTSRTGICFGTDDNRPRPVRALPDRRAGLADGRRRRDPGQPRCIGIVWGAIAGFVGGRVDGVMMRIVDMMYRVPYMLFVMILMVRLRPRVLPRRASRSARSRGWTWRASCAARRCA